MNSKKGTPSRRNAQPASRRSPQQARGMDLASIFNVATQALSANQASLNQADTENQNHGDNMVQVFNMISQVMAKQPGASPSEQLNQASQYLSQHGTSGSAQVYSQGLQQAAQQFQGQSAVTPDNAMTLVQSLLGGGQSTSQGADLLGSLLSGGQPSTQGSDAQGSGLDLGDLLNAGMTFMNAKQQGQDNLQAALSTLMASGPMGQKPHRQQSGQVVANALLQAVAGMGKRK